MDTNVTNGFTVIASYLHIVIERNEAISCYETDCFVPRNEAHFPTPFSQLPIIVCIR